MTSGDEDLLTTTEGVDEGSAASTVEGPDSGATPSTGATVTVEGEQPAPPVDMETDAIRATRDEYDTGQQQDTGVG